MHTAVKHLNETLEFDLSLVAENVLENLDNIPKRYPSDSDFSEWWIDALEYITCSDLLHDNPEYYYDLGGKDFFVNLYKKMV